MKNNKKIIITAIIAVIVIMIGATVGISINRHNIAVKEALSVSESKEDVYNSFNDEFKAITDKEYKTVEEFESAKKNLSSLKDKINVSDIKEDERLVAIVSDIDKTIEEYDGKIKALTTTTTVTTTTEKTTEATTEATTKKAVDKPVNATTTKSNYSSNKTTTTKSNKSKTNKNKNKNKVTTTKAKTTVKQTTTKKKSYDPDPAYGTVKFSYPEGNYKVNHWSCGHVYWKWNGKEWEVEIHASGMMHYPCNTEDFVDQCLLAFPEPNRDGKYKGEEVDKAIYVWN